MSIDSGDARRAHSDFARQARSLGALSANAALHAERLISSYHEALFAAELPAPVALWRDVVGAADGLLEVADALDRMAALRPAELAARAYFRQFVDENADLLPVPLLAA